MTEQAPGLGSYDIPTPENQPYLPDQSVLQARQAIIAREIDPLKAAIASGYLSVPNEIQELAFEQKMLEAANREMQTRTVHDLIAEKQARIKELAEESDARTGRLEEVLKRTMAIAESEPESVDRGMVLNPAKAHEMALAEDPHRQKAKGFLARKGKHLERAAEASNRAAMNYKIKLREH
jgi:hypothetical protein